MDILIIEVLIAASALLLSSPTRQSRLWSATLTRPAFIIGGGFLVSAP